jgi:hypothetical protein
MVVSSVDRILFLAAPLTLETLQKELRELFKVDLDIAYEDGEVT